jgi:hypothetical protein
MRKEADLQNLMKFRLKALWAISLALTTLQPLKGLSLCGSVPKRI